MLAYLANLMPGLWVFLPLAIYFWKGRRSPFIGFHCVQALLLAVTLIPAMGVVFFLMLEVQVALDHRPIAHVYANLAVFTMFGMALVLLSSKYI